MVSVALFGEFEFRAAMIKVVALLSFLVAGTIFLAGCYQIDGHQPIQCSMTMAAVPDRPVPTGRRPPASFAYAAVELSAPPRVRPRSREGHAAGHQLGDRPIALFYVGSLFLLALLLPTPSHSAAESPFVTFFGKIGITGGGTVMNLVVMTAAFSSLNAGCTHRPHPALHGDQRKRTQVHRADVTTGVPYGGICLTASIGLFGVLLNGVVPEKAFEIVLNVAPRWESVVGRPSSSARSSCSMVATGPMERPSFRMWGSPHTGYLTLAFLFAAGADGFQLSDRHLTVASPVVVIPALIGGWFRCESGSRGSTGPVSWLDRTRTSVPGRSAPGGEPRPQPGQREPRLVARYPRSPDSGRPRAPGDSPGGLCRRAAPGR